jgi:hypothetical protein
MAGVDARVRGAVVVFALAGASLFAFPAAAQSGGESATAQALFDQARTLMDSGHAEEACPKFEESQRLDPGSGTLLNLARCYEQTGRLASAWSKYLETVAAAKNVGNSGREAEARARADALKPRLSNLSVTPAPELRNVQGLEITRDGAPVGSAQWGLPIPADEGEHKLAAKAPGYRPWETVVVVKGEGSTATAEVPMLVQAPETTGATPGGTPGEIQEPGKHGLGTQRIVAIATAGVGVVGLAVGTIFGVKSMSDHDEAAKYCSGSLCTDPRGVTAGNDAHSAGNVATIAMIAGGVCVAGGAVLWFTAPKSSGPSTSVGFGPGSVQMKGTF